LKKRNKREKKRKEQNVKESDERVTRE